MVSGRVCFDALCGLFSVFVSNGVDSLVVSFGFGFSSFAGDFAFVLIGGLWYCVV